MCVRKNILILVHLYLRCFPGSLVGKESACSAGDPSSIPGSGRSHGEGILQYSWTSLVVQSLKNLPAMQEPGFNPWFGKPGGGNGNPHQYSCLENPHGQRSLAGCSPWGCKELDMTDQISILYFRET